LAGLGGMMSVALPVDRVEELLAPYAGRLSIAAVHGPAAVVVAGEVAALDEVFEACDRAGLPARKVKVDYPPPSQPVPGTLTIPRTTSSRTHGCDSAENRPVNPHSSRSPTCTAAASTGCSIRSSPAATTSPPCAD
ncbi:hypothetical protein VM98_33750, partial [Streptomyces rubellomurinus subsp. indigoferus]